VESVEPGTLYIVSTPIGNLSDITFRAVHILKEVDLIAAEDTRLTSILLRHYEISTKTISFHSYNQNRQTPLVLNLLKEGKTIAIVSDAGTPGISDPAYMLVRAAIESDIRIVPIPGPSAFLATLVVSGLPANRFVFEGFLPLKKGRKTKIEQLTVEPRTLVFYESPHRIVRTVNELFNAWGDRQCVMGREITKKFEEFFRGPFSALANRLENNKPKGEIVLIVAGAGTKEKRAKHHPSDK
jgi:16S rRNA (cytidine1402-2'-O)-methyltransferase